MIDSTCFLCGETHPWKECPKMEAKPPVPAFPIDLPKSQDTLASLPPTQFEQIFGTGAEGLLQDVTDGAPEDWTDEQRSLALRILSGDASMRSKNNEEQRILDDIAQQMAFGQYPSKTTQTPTRVVRDIRPPHIRSQSEMEHFPEEFQPFPSLRDWPLSSDHPEGSQD